MSKIKQKQTKTLSWTLVMMRLTGIGIIASGAATAAVPEMRTLMIPSFAICATLFGMTLLSTLAKPKIKKKKTLKKEEDNAVILEPEDLMDSFEDDSSHLILISSPYFVQQAKITPNKGVTPDSIINCMASAKGLANEETPSIVYSWRNASTGAFLGTRSQLDLTSTLVRPGQSIECLVTAEDHCGDMATSLAKVLIEANLTMPETPTERFNLKELREKRESLSYNEIKRNKGRRSSDERGTLKTLDSKEKSRRNHQSEKTTKRRPLKQVYENDDSSNIFTTSGMWD